MSVKQTRAYIQTAISQLHQATVEFQNTPKRHKYLEVSNLNIKVEQMLIELRVLDMLARDTLQKVLIREGKNPSNDK